MNKSKKNINNKEKENIFGGMTPKSHDLQKHIVLGFSVPIITEVFMGFDITNKEYDEKVKKISPNSRIFVDMLLVFFLDGEAPGMFALIGGAFVILVISAWMIISNKEEKAKKTIGESENL